MKDSFSHVLVNAVDKWKENSEGSFCLSRSFQKHHLKYKDTYLKYIQFRTLHHMFFTNDKLFKMGIKKSDLCSFCLKEPDSVKRMLLHCEKTRELWCGVGNWIRGLGMGNYHLSNARIVLGDLENALYINTIILLTKTSIYNAMKKEQIPNIINVKNDTKNFYFQEKYRHYIRGKGKIFDKQYMLLTNIYLTT